ncbi:MAG: AAC(3) family N-acetyltransferase [Magnetococcales bacterium]|nr:AAC(3) family N-acetyltransferase [Magnetococcales bacterium]
MNAPWIVRAKQRVKGEWKKRRLAWVRRWHGFGPDELHRSLTRLGIGAGDVVLVHSSLDRLEAFNGRITALLTTLQMAVGSEGLLMMPTLPFAGTAVEWARSGVCFDVRTTPSRSGLLTELFRRSPGVFRSVHPTHAVAIWGARAEAFGRDHSGCTTPCGAGSPYAKLLEENGKILFLGAGIEAMTFFHAAEALLESRLPVSPFTGEHFRLLSRTASGEQVTTVTRLFDPALSRKRRIDRMVPELKRRGAWRQVRLGGADLLCLEARAVLATLTDMALEGKYCYDL